MTTYRRFALLFVLALLFLIWMAGCLPVSKTPVSGASSPTLGVWTSTPVPTIRLESSSTPIPVPPPSTIPTVTLYEEGLLYSLLQSPACNLPCYLHIVPGQTSWEEAQSILAGVGASPYGEGKDGNLPSYGFMLWVGDPSVSNATRTTESLLGDTEIYHHVSLTVGDDKVQRINVSILTRKLSSKYLEYWSRYSLQQIFLQHGVPDEIYFSRFDEFDFGVSMAIAYKKPGIVISFNGQRAGNIICPAFESRDYIERDFVLTNPDFSLNIFLPKQSIMTDREYWLPIDEYLELSKKEFYDQILSVPASCFEVKDMKP